MSSSIADRTSPRILGELLVLLSVPVILAAVYYWTPISFQQQFVLDHTAPKLHAFWTSALVHDHRPGDGHLLGNIVTYLLLVLPTWLLYRMRGQKRAFWTAIFLLLAFGPLITSSSSYLFLHEYHGIQIQNERGFSGVVGAFGGFLIMSLLRTFEREQREDVALLSMGLYASYLFLGFGVVTRRIPIAFVGFVGLVVTFASTYTDRVATVDQWVAWAKNNTILTGLLVVAAILSASAFAAALPQDIMSEAGGLKNIVSHGSGILFGMAVALGLRSINRYKASLPLFN